MTIPTPIKVQSEPIIIFRLMISSKLSKIEKYEMTKAFIIASTGARSVSGVIFEISYFVIK